MTDLAIDVQGLVKRFGNKVAVDGVDLRMPKGKVWGFLGPNGSGKTTTIRMICGLLLADEGGGHCLGYDIRREAESIRHETGYMTQRFSFWEDLTIRENLAFVAKLYQIPHMKKKIDDTLDGLGLTQRQHQLAGALSGGWKQRLALAAVTMHDPQLLLLDEPTAGVDPQARRDFWDEIHFLSNRGLTVLVSTHYMDEAERCDEIVYLAHGKLITQGPVDDIIAQAGLVCFRLSGNGVRDLAGAFRDEPGVDHTAYYSNALYISGPDRGDLSRAIEKIVPPQIKVEEVQPTLEDVFIELMDRAGADNRVYE